MAYASRRFGFHFSLTPVVKRLLIANAVVFLAVAITGRGGARFALEWLAFQPDRVLTRPWGMITYMFVHADFMHLFVNMLVLFFFGPPLESRWGRNEFLRFYLVAGLGGVALSFLLAPTGLVGASAACFGLMLAFAMNWPDSPIYVWGIFPIKAKWLVTFLGVMALFGALGASGGGVAHLAHLGGLAAGFLYLKADWRSSAALDRLRRAAPKSPRRLAIVPRDEDEESDVEATAPRRSRRPEAGVRAGSPDERRMLDEVDRVLDKISAQGMASLTAEERRLLDEVSRRHRLN
jgi:membrane associated rhomboid family serine protease